MSKEICHLDVRRSAQGPSRCRRRCATSRARARTPAGRPRTAAAARPRRCTRRHKGRRRLRTSSPRRCGRSSCGPRTSRSGDARKRPVLAAVRRCLSLHLVVAELLVGAEHRRFSDGQPPRLKRRQRRTVGAVSLAHHFDRHAQHAGKPLGRASVSSSWTERLRHEVAIARGTRSRAGARAEGARKLGKRRVTLALIGGHIAATGAPELGEQEAEVSVIVAERVYVRGDGAVQRVAHEMDTQPAAARRARAQVLDSQRRLAARLLVKHFLV
eukprot:scaffold59035_cov63-Phaeocystis_antarctica.AAC.11